MSPQLARRVAILGAVGFVLFAALFFRLWFLEVLSGESYVSQAAQNRVRKIRIEAPRGDVVDRNGNTLVKTRQAAVVQIQPGELPEAERALAVGYGAKVSAAERDRLAADKQLRDLKQQVKRTRRKGKKVRLSRPQKRERRRLARAAAKARPVPIPKVGSDPAARSLYVRLGRVLKMPPSIIHRRVIEQVAQTPYAAVTVKTDVGRAAFSYLLERQDQFPGVRPETQYLRSYPLHKLGAQLFGTLREISPDELSEKRYKGVQEGERIGKDGIEESYDKYLRGQDGYYRQVVDALGQSCDDPVRCPVKKVKPTQGNQLQLTLDLRLEKAGVDAVQRSIDGAAGNGSQAGAFVAMDPRNGAILGMGSLPSYDANLFAKPISQSNFNELNSEAAGTPLLNRAIDGLYPTGSTFKLITATAALESGLLTPTTVYDDRGSYSVGTQRFENAGGVVNGPLNIIRALTVSSDVFFYQLGYQLYSQPGQVLQTWARRLGLGHATGVDLPGEFPGLVPDRQYRNEGFAEYLRCVKREKVPAHTTEALLACGGIEKPYTPGDNVNLAVGQGDLQATPLQMAVAYSTLANGGTVVTPHLGQAIQDGQGALVQKLRFAARDQLNISDTTRSAILEGLRGAASEPGGTSTDVFKGVDLEVYGKTGTAERGVGNPDQSWYVAYVPNEQRPIVVAVTIEKGGFGAETAAPAACRILTTWFDQSPNRCASGSSTTR